MDDFDVEEQSTRSSDRESGVYDEFVGTRLNEAKSKLWLAKFGSNPVCPVGQHYNPHGILAGQRYVCEKVACQIAEENGVPVVDSGGAAHRTYEWLGAKGWYQMPAVHLGDRTRRGRIPEGAAERVCMHRFEECVCPVLDEPHCFLMVHSAYYIDPMSMWTRLSDLLCVDCLVVEHVFPDMFGGFYDEATWSLERDVVTMDVAGNGNPYIHQLAPWQRGWRGPGGEALVAETLFSMDGVTRVVRIQPVFSYAGPAKALTWSDVQASNYLAGPIQFSDAQRNAVADNAKFGTVSFDLDKIEKVGPVLFSVGIFKGERISITVPINGVSQVATHCLNKPRTPELLAEVTHVMRGRMAKARIPPDQLAQVLAGMIALGFVINIRNEMNVNHTMVSRFDWAMKAHSTLLRFGKVTISWIRWLVLGFVVVATALTLFDVLDDVVWERVVVSLCVVALCLTCLCCMWTCTRVARAYRDYMEAGWTSSYSNDEGPRAPLLGQGFVLQRNLPLPGSRHLKIADQLGSGTIKLGTSREKASEPSRMLVSGPVLDGSIPNALAGSQAAERCAVENRVLTVRNNPTKEALVSYKAAFEREEFKAVDDSNIALDETAHNGWLLHMAKTYPKAYVENLRKIWRENCGTMSEPVASKAHLKVEKSASTMGVDDCKPTKARLIQPPEDIDKTMTGLVAHTLAQRLRKAWDGIKTPVMYVSGYSGAQVGQRVDAFIAANGGEEDVVCWSLDMANYDATLGIDLQAPIFNWYVLLGMAAWLISWFTRVRSRGTTPNGVTYAPTREWFFDIDDDEGQQALLAMCTKYKLKVHSAGEVNTPDRGNCYRIIVEDFQMTSGRMDTNLTDTVALVAALLSEMPKVPYLLLACGDDGFLMLRKEHRDVIDTLTRQCRALGMKPSGVVSSKRSEWEFCSKLFWFARTSSGLDYTVLGSKPFRGIARMGVNTTLAGAANAAQAALSVRIDSGHVPFLGPFADRVKDLCVQKRIRPIGKVEWSAITGGARHATSPLNYIITQERYNLGEENEMEFKRLLANLTEPTSVLGYPPSLLAVRVDEA